MWERCGSAFNLSAALGEVALCLPGLFPGVGVWGLAGDGSWDTWEMWAGVRVAWWSVAVLGLRLGHWVSRNIERRRSVHSLPGFLAGMGFGLGACWN